MSRKATIIFANCAGSARDENSNPKELGRFIASKLLDTEQFGDVIAVGLSEIILSSDPEQGTPKAKFEPELPGHQFFFG